VLLQNKHTGVFVRPVYKSLESNTVEVIAQCDTADRRGDCVQRGREPLGSNPMPGIAVLSYLVSLSGFDSSYALRSLNLNLGQVPSWQWKLFLCRSGGKLVEFKIDLASQGNIYDDGRLMW